MNDVKRKMLENIKQRLEAIKAEISSIRKEEERAWSRMPESLQESVTGDKISEACNKLEWAEDDLGGVIGHIEMAQK